MGGGVAAVTDDEKLLRALGGATFGPDASLTLPSGRRIDSDEAQAFTSLYASPEGAAAVRSEIEPQPADRHRLPQYESDDVGRPFALLEEQLRSAHEVVFLLVQRLGGEVELTAEELTGMDPAWELVSWNNPATDGLVVQCRKPPKATS
jgi:hypothetical protein